MRRSTYSGSLLAAAALLLLLAGVGPGHAGLVTERYIFTEPDVQAVGRYHRVTMDEAWSLADPGKPVLPMCGSTLLLPPGEVPTGVRVLLGDRVVLGDGYLVEPGQRQYPLSHTGAVERIEADYEGLGIYPESKHGDLMFGYFRGHGLASVAVFPVEYDPATGELSYYTSMVVEVDTAPTEDAMRTARSMLRNDDRTVSRISRLADNPSARAPYSHFGRARPLNRTLEPSDGYKYIIVTTDAWDEYLETFADFQTQRGNKAGIFLKSWITANYVGIDEQAQIRNFIIDAYGTWDIDYVLLAGDAREVDGIPHRGMWNDANGSTDDDIPCDLYYAGLDGTWNQDGDDRWGEYNPEEADLYPEVAVGRACIDSPEAAQNFVTKTMRYIDAPIVSECDEALMVGELLWSYPLTWGGDYADEMIGGSSANGYTTVGVQPSMSIDTLYDRDWPDEDWPESEIKSRMMAGLNIVNHMGHCNVQYALKMTNEDLPEFTNDGVNHLNNFFYSQGCYNGAFDDRGSSGTYIGDCFGEEATLDDAGIVAAVLNSRYGWGDPGGTNGASQYFAREFFDALFGEGIYPLGEINNDSKMDVIWALSAGGNRWCYYQLNVFGDPAMHIWTAEPASLTVDHPQSVMVGQPSFDLLVTDGRAAMEGARVSVWTDDYSVYDSAATNSIGVATLSAGADSLGTLSIKVTAHDFLTWDASIPIEPASGPYVVLHDYVVDDDQSGESSGDSDGTVKAGETIELVVTLENALTDPANGVTATLSTLGEWVTIVDDHEEFGDIAPLGTAQCADDYGFTVASDTPDGETVTFQLTIGDSSRGTWKSYFSIDVSAPIVTLDSYEADDPLYGGDGSGCMEAGETFSLGLTLANDGGASATGLTATLSSDDPYVVINEPAAGMSELAAGASQPVSPDYSITLLPGCPELHEIEFDVSVSADWGYVASGELSILTGGPPFDDDVESGEGEWVHHVVTPSFVDEWHVETNRYYSTGHSWKSGGAGSEYYADSSDGVLVMRPMCLGANAVFSFWHWMEAEDERPGPVAWDCGLVEISTDGGVTWDVLHPDDEYTHTKNDNPANPLPEGTPCWSGDFDWREETFDLSALEGQTIQIRFRFVSDGYVTYEGWYVDDIAVAFDDAGSSTTVDEETLPRRFALLQNSPNPFRPATRIRYELPHPEHVRIDVFDISGRHVKTVVDERQDAGYRSVSWDGTNARGDEVASGIYMYRMDAGGFTSRKMMILIK